MMPLHMARHNAGVYLAASLARPSIRAWCAWDPSHLRLSSLPMTFELVMNLVGFLAGTNWDFRAPQVLNPNMH